MAISFDSLVFQFLSEKNLTSYRVWLFAHGHRGLPCHLSCPPTLCPMPQSIYNWLTVLPSMSLFDCRSSSCFRGQFVMKICRLLSCLCRVDACSPAWQDKRCAMRLPPRRRLTEPSCAACRCVFTAVFAAERETHKQKSQNYLFLARHSQLETSTKATRSHGRTQ